MAANMAVRSLCWRLSREPAQVRHAREQAGQALSRWGLGEHADLAELIVSELATNAIRHGHGVVSVCVSYAYGYLRVDVHNNGAGRPARRQATPDDESGRGLALLDGLIGLHGGRRGVATEITGLDRPGDRRSRTHGTQEPRRRAVRARRTPPQRGALACPGASDVRARAAVPGRGRTRPRGCPGDRLSPRAGLEPAAQRHRRVRRHRGAASRRHRYRASPRSQPVTRECLTAEPGAPARCPVLYGRACAGGPRRTAGPLPDPARPSPIPTPYIRPIPRKGKSPSGGHPGRQVPTQC
jgi:anti-sigma regulatory factor (Ser/Thr protein kinase)